MYISNNPTINYYEKIIFDDETNNEILNNQSKNADFISSNNNQL
jgi:hypothetical protein